MSEHGRDAGDASEAGAPCVLSTTAAPLPPSPGQTKWEEVRATEEELDAFMADHEQILAAADAFERESTPANPIVCRCVCQQQFYQSLVRMLCVCVVHVSGADGMRWFMSCAISRIMLARQPPSPNIMIAT